MIVELCCWLIVDWVCVSCCDVVWCGCDVRCISCDVVVELCCVVSWY